MSISLTVNGQSGPNLTATTGDTISVTVTNAGAPGGQGSQGPAGPANSLSIGTVEAGASAAATITGKAPSQVLNLVLPAGEKGSTGATGSTGSTGPAGPANSLSIGTVTAGGSASATITGTAPTQTLNLVLPQGEPGEQGPQGPAGSVPLADETPQPLGAASAGVAITAARADHVHAVPTISWNSLADVPSTFTPAAHTQSISTITGLQTALDSKQAAGTYATLVNGTVPSAQLPGYVDDVVEVATAGSLPATGEAGKLYVALDTKKLWRWSGSSYVEISPSPGSTDSVVEGSTNLYFTDARALAAIPVASSSVAGLVKVGTGLSIASGVLSASGSGGDDSRWDYFKPPAPASITATAGNAEVNVSWSLPTVLAQTPLTNFALQYSTDKSSWTAFTSATAYTGTVVDSLTNGTPYWFRVAGINGIGQGPWKTTTQSVTPQAPENPILSASGLYAWYDASVGGSLYDAQSGGNIVTSDGSPIYRVADQSGQGRHLYTFYSGSDVPRLAAAVKNGKNAITFDNTSRNDTFKSAANRESGTFQTGNPLTVFAVWYVPTGTNDTYLFDDVRYSWFDREYSTATGISLAGGAVSMYQPTQSTWTGTNTGRSGTWMVVRAVFAGTGSTLAVNGSYDAPGGPNSNPGGGTASNYNFPQSCADIRVTGRYTLGELIFFSGALDGSTCSAIETFLMTKWGIS